MQRVIVLICLLLAAVGWATWTLRAASGERILGQPPVTAAETTIAAVRQQPDSFAGQTVAITGRITQCCPSAGCWFYLNDGTGNLRVDARPGGFSVLGLPTGAQVTAYGVLTQEPGEDLQLSAVGARL